MQAVGRPTGGNPTATSYRHPFTSYWFQECDVGRPTRGNPTATDPELAPSCEFSHVGRPTGGNPTATWDLLLNSH